MKELPIPEADPAEVDRQIADILDAPEYDYTDPWYEPIRRWTLDLIADVLGWIGRRISDFFGLFRGTGIGGVGGAGLAARIIAYAVIAAFVLLIARLIWRMVQDRLPKPVSYDDGPVVDIDTWDRPKELLAKAERFEEEGRWDEALRFRYRYVVATLVERRLIDNPPGRTTGEYRAEVDHWLPGSASGFASITATFEMVWYGEIVPDREMVAEVRHIGDAVLAAATKRRPESTVATADSELVG